MNSKAFLLLIFVAVPRLVNSEQPTPASDGQSGADIQIALEDLSDEINQALEDFNTPGLAIAIVAGGEIVYEGGFGLRDVEAQKPMTQNTLFAIGSTTKAMTVTVLGMLVDEGKLDWDEPLRKYLPTFRLSDSAVSERLTPGIW